MSNCVHVRTLFSNDATFGTKCFNNSFTRIKAIKTIKCAICIYNLCISIQDHDARQAVAHTNLEVINIMSWSYLDRTGSKSWIYMLVCNNRNLTVDQRNLYRLTDHVRITLIIWIYSNRGITQHCFSPGCSNNNCIITLAIAD